MDRFKVLASEGILDISSTLDYAHIANSIHGGASVQPDSIHPVGCNSVEVPGGIYNASGRISLLKTLMTNACGCDCRYCWNSAECKRKRTSLTPEELAANFLSLNKNGQAGGLFLSSGIAGDADSSMRRMLDGIKLIRTKGFKGYIHLKILPGAGRDLITEAALYADRLSINMEAPTKLHLSELSSTKDFKSDILRRQEWIRDAKPRAGHTTQMVVGAGDETDLEILEAAKMAYEKMHVSRVYYSPFYPLPGTPLESREATPVARARRLYCVDFMMRRYGVELQDFKNVMDGGNLPPGDPKVHLALEYFDGPVDVKDAEYEELLRVPGIGPVGAYCITALKEMGLDVTRSRLASIGVGLKRAEPFIKLDGRVQKKMTDFGE